MALIKCPECNNQVSDRARLCPHCGYPINETQKKDEECIFCTECGKKNSKNSMYCTNCGSSLSCIDNDSVQSKLTENLDEISLDDFIENELKNAAKTKVEKQRDEGHNKVSCPMCGSTSLSANKKGYRFIKGVAGTVALGPLGAFAGGMGANKIIVTCLNCGFKFER